MKKERERKERKRSKRKENTLCIFCGHYGFTCPSFSVIRSNKEIVSDNLLWEPVKISKL